MEGGRGVQLNVSRHNCSTTAAGRANFATDMAMGMMRDLEGEGVCLCVCF